jgi:restriction system protein
VTTSQGNALNWTELYYRLDSFEESLATIRYAGAFDAPIDDSSGEPNLEDAPPGAIALDQIPLILSAKSLAAPHGLQLLDPIHPNIPQFPARPSGPCPSAFSVTAERADRLERRREELQQAFEGKFRVECEELEILRRDCLANDPGAISLLLQLSHVRHPFPKVLHRPLEVDLDLSAHRVLCTLEVPDFTSLAIVQKRGTSQNAKWSLVSAVERRRSTETILYALCLRVAYLAASADAGGWFDTVAVNAKQKWNDAATGVPCEGIIASLQASRADLLRLQLNQVDPKVCFRHLKGIVTPSVDRVSPIRPIFVLNTDDQRIIENRDVADRIDEEANLAAMPWDDFEQLVRQLFEWEFGQNGVEVKVTRASRDRGVDAIMFDPDPLRGGKYVLQAKRYTRPVDVAAVRDLYGTLVNEGANRGILVTTSSYGADSYEFAKDKPISLVDGQNLVAMLKRHGRRFRIDLAEARRQEANEKAIYG